MKIFQIITVSEYGGAQSVVASLLEELNKNPNNTLYVLSGGEGESWKHLDSRIVRIKIDKHRKQISIKDFLLLFKLFYYRFKYNPDIVHLHSSKMGALGRIAFSRKKTVYTVHGFDSIRKAFKKYLFLEKILKNKTACIVGVSKYDVECLKEEGIEQNVAMVYNGIHDYASDSKDIPFPEQFVKLEDIKKKYTKVMMCISRISKQKKFDLFLEVAEQMPQYAFVWIGNKEDVPNLPSNVFCLGECHSAHRCLDYADIFILPSNYEGMPVSVIEALSYGKPVVASFVGGLPEMLNGENGFAVDNNVDSFVEKINFILRSEKDVYSRMSSEARRTYENHFTIDKMIEGYEDIYRMIISKNKKS